MSVFSDLNTLEATREQHQSVDVAAEVSEVVKEVVGMSGESLTAEDVHRLSMELIDSRIESGEWFEVQGEYFWTAE